MQKKNIVVMMMMELHPIKAIIKSEIIIIILENIEELLMIFLIEHIKHQTKFLWYFIMVLHTISTSKSKG